MRTTWMPSSAIAERCVSHCDCGSLKRSPGFTPKKPSGAGPAARVLAGRNSAAERGDEGPRALRRRELGRAVEVVLAGPAVVRVDDAVVLDDRPAGASGPPQLYDVRPRGHALGGAAAAVEPAPLRQEARHAPGAARPGAAVGDDVVDRA